MQFLHFREARDTTNTKQISRDKLKDEITTQHDIYDLVISTVTNKELSVQKLHLSTDFSP